MNIIVKTFSGKYIVRPDTTWDRDNEDFYVPEFVDRISYSPVLFARITKPGRSIGEKFAGRYFEGINYGVLLYPDDMMDGSPEGFACASCLDHSSFLPFPVYNNLTLGQEDNHFILKRNGDVCIDTNEGKLSEIGRSLSEASRYIYLRSGDLIAIELREKALLGTREDNGLEMTASFCDNTTIDFKIIF